MIYTSHLTLNKKCCLTMVFDKHTHGKLQNMLKCLTKTKFVMLTQQGLSHCETHTFLCVKYVNKDNDL